MFKKFEWFDRWPTELFNLGANLRRTGRRIRAEAAGRRVGVPKFIIHRNSEKFSLKLMQNSMKIAGKSRFLQKFQQKYEKV